jgi:hypothetical protein
VTGKHRLQCTCVDVRPFAPETWCDYCRGRAARRLLRLWQGYAGDRRG